MIPIRPRMCLLSKIKIQIQQPKVSLFTKIWDFISGYHISLFFFFFCPLLSMFNTSTTKGSLFHTVVLQLLSCLWKFHKVIVHHSALLLGDQKLNTNTQPMKSSPFASKMRARLRWFEEIVNLHWPLVSFILGIMWTGDEFKRSQHASQG